MRLQRAPDALVGVCKPLQTGANGLQHSCTSAVARQALAETMACKGSTRGLQRPSDGAQGRAWG
eukprot:15479830-Alexandrium_andersonii.AAC.1